MRLLLDTHAFLWFLIDDRQLSAKADAVISDPNNEIEVSPATKTQSTQGIQVEADDIQAGPALCHRLCKRTVTGRPSSRLCVFIVS